MSSGRDVETRDLAFERLLLDSARSDGPSPETTDRAWHQFTTRVAAAAVVAGAAPDPTALARAARRAMLQWLGIGVVGGSALTALWLHSGETWKSRDPQMRQATPVVAPRTEQGGAQRPSSVPLAAPSASTELREGQAPESQGPVSATRKGRQRKKPATVAEASLLAKEIAALDAARAAVAASDASSALRMVEEYRREFPRGQLTADAHALEIEALHAQGDRDSARRRFARFRARYPNDPHAARLEQLVDE